jgi:MFS family permease
MNKKNQIISFVAIILGFFMALLDTTIVNITLPKMTEYFDTTMDHISWVVNAYNLASAVIIITASRLADQFGRKKLFVTGVFYLLYHHCYVVLQILFKHLYYFEHFKGYPQLLL